jgi:hypothetical protein
MDAENTVEGEDGKSGTPEGQAAPSGEGAGVGDVAAAPEVRMDPPGAEPPALEPTQTEQAVAGEVRRLNHMTTTHLPLEQLDEDTTLRIRPEGDVSALARDLARLGQMFPVDVRPRGERYQLISGFRRVAALRFLQRDRVLARVHTDLSDEDALLMSLAAAIHGAPVDAETLAAKRDELEAAGRLSAAARDMLGKALETEDGLAPEGVEEEVDADELAADAAQRLGELNQDLSLLADVFAALDEARKAELLMQLRYSADLVAYLEGL